MEAFNAFNWAASGAQQLSISVCGFFSKLASSFSPSFRSCRELVEPLVASVASAGKLSLESSNEWELAELELKLVDSLNGFACSSIGAEFVVGVRWLLDEFCVNWMMTISTNGQQNVRHQQQ